MQLNADGTGNCSTKGAYADPSNDEITWKTEGDTLFLLFDGESMIFGVSGVKDRAQGGGTYSLEGNSLKIYWPRYGEVIFQRD